MRGLTVLYDSHCPLCRRVKDWLAGEPAYLALELVPAGSLEAEARFPDLDPLSTLGQLTVIDDEGGVYRGEDAYLMCLYALVDYRAWALSLAGGERRLLRLCVRALEALRGSTRCGGACSIAPAGRGADARVAAQGSASSANTG
ncbi:MAG: DCC1-like thiol-disulfide oxidoreductase family protein [Planctomycetota bacterium]